MARYLMARRLCGRTRNDPQTQDLRATAASFANVIDQPASGEDQPYRPVLLDSDPKEIHQKRKELSSALILEEERMRRTAIYSPLSAAAPLPIEAGAGLGSAIELTLSSQGTPLASALVTMLAYSYRGFATTVNVMSDDAGRATIPFDARFWVPASLQITPRANAWSVLAPVARAELALSLPPLPHNGPLGWWHGALGVTDWAEDLGKGIRVGVIDTGVGPHPALAHVKRAGAFLNSWHDPNVEATNDVADHGTHVSGIVGARPVNRQDYAGIAPGADLIAARVYPGGGPPGMEAGAASSADIAQAILVLSRDEQCDIINLSSGGMAPSEIETDRIANAFEEGTLVICAAGNTGGPVIFPAADPSTIGVSAVGLFGHIPYGVMDAFSTPWQPDRFGFGGTFFPTFNSIGPEITCAAPGHGIISTVPSQGNEAPYAAMSGTSMAAPAVAGALAAILSGDPTYKSMPRNRDRSLRAWKLLASALRSLGMMPHYQGCGLPTIRH